MPLCRSVTSGRRPACRPRAGTARALHALRLASVKAAVYLGRTAVGHSPANSAVFDSLGPVETSRPGLPRIAYIGQVHSRQRVAEVDEPILYGANTAGMAPVLLHPNEWLDGALVTSYISTRWRPIFTRIIRLSWNSIAGIARAKSRWSGPSPLWPVLIMMIAPEMPCWQPIRRNGVSRLRGSF